MSKKFITLTIIEPINRAIKTTRVIAVDAICHMEVKHYTDLGRECNPYTQMTTIDEYVHDILEMPTDILAMIENEAINV